MEGGVRHRATGWHLFVSGALMAVLCLAHGESAAQQIGVEEPESDRRFRVYLHEPVQVFADPLAERRAQVRSIVEQTADAIMPLSIQDGADDATKAGYLKLDPDVIADALRRHFAQDESRFVVLPREALLQAIESKGDKAGLTAIEFVRNDRQADALKKDGIRALERLDLRRAEEKLSQAIELYEDIAGDFIYPEVLAEAYEVLVLVHDELRNRAEDVDPDLEARWMAALRRLVRLAPDRHLVYPFYATSLEKSYLQARAQVIAQRVAGRDPVDLETAQRVGALVDADIVLWAYVIQDESGALTLQLHMNRPSSSEAVYVEPQSIALAEGAADHAERASRLASRFAACIEPLPEPPPPLVDREKGHFYLDSAFAYYYYLRPVEMRFDNFGFNLLGSYMLSDNFGLLGRVTLLTSGRDFDGDLLDTVGSVRTALGGEFSLRFEFLRPTLAFAIEANRTSSFRRTDEFFCKISASAPDCEPGDIESKDARWLIGVNSQLGLSLRLYRQLFMSVRGGFSFYTLPFGGKPLNFLLGFDSGLAYRF